MEEIRKDGKYISSDNLGIPESVKDYWQFGDYLMKDYYKKKITQDLIFKDYVDMVDYMSQKDDSILKSIDALSHDFMKLLTTDQLMNFYEIK